jgi:hypothetical protein
MHAAVMTCGRLRGGWLAARKHVLGEGSSESHGPGPDGRTKGIDRRRRRLLVFGTVLPFLLSVAMGLQAWLSAPTLLPLTQYSVLTVSSRGRAPCHCHCHCHDLGSLWSVALWRAAIFDCRAHSICLQSAASFVLWVGGLFNINKKKMPTQDKQPNFKTSVVSNRF